MVRFLGCLVTAGIVAEKQKRVLLFFRQATFVLKTHGD